MGSLRLVLSAELRRRWRSWLALAALVALAGGFVMAASEAGRRTASAFPNYVAKYGFDTLAYATRPVPQLDRLPVVSSAFLLLGPDNGRPTCRCTQPIDPTDFGVLFVPPKDGPVYKFISGHLPDPADPYQVLASYTLRQDAGVHLGTVVRVPFYLPRQAAAYNAAVGAAPVPRGPTIAFTVVGFEASEFEFPSGTTPSYDLYATPAFAREVLPHLAFDDLYLVRLHDGAAGVPRFVGEASSLNLPGLEGFESLAEEAASVEASVHPQAVGWWILAALAGFVGLAVVGQALFRQSAIESEEYPTLAALGADRRQLFAQQMARNLAVGLVGAVGAVMLAFLLSPIAPLGEARTAEPSAGFVFDLLVLPLGALATVVAVLALGLWPARRMARRLRPDNRTAPGRPSVVATRLGAMGAPPSALIGVRHALERRSGGSSVPVGSALLGTVVAVIALSGTVVFGSSLSHLTATPQLYGDTFQLNFTNVGGAAPAAGLLHRLEKDKDVTGITRGLAIQLTVDHLALGAVAATPIRGQLLFATVSGKTPRSADEIGLGSTSMRKLGAHIGSVVRVTVQLPGGGTRTAPFRVVSQVSLPVLGGVVSLGTGALLTTEGLGYAACAPGPRQSACKRAVATYSIVGGGLLASVVPGAAGRADVRRYLDAYQSVAVVPTTPTSLINFGEAVNFPLIFGALLAAFGAATLAHLLIVSASRRRQEIGLLKALGFVNGQIGSIVAWQATTLAVVGAVVGVPLGVVIGRVVWDAFANNLGAVPVPVVPVWVLLVMVAGVLLAANLIAIGPALVAARFRPVQLLRAQ